MSRLASPTSLVLLRRCAAFEPIDELERRTLRGVRRKEKEERLSIGSDVAFPGRRFAEEKLFLTDFDVSRS